MGLGATARSPGAVCEGGQPDNTLVTHVRLSQRKKTAEGNNKTAGKTNGAEMVTGTRRVWSNSRQEWQQPENNLVAFWSWRHM